MPKPSRLKGLDKLQAHVPGLRTPFRSVLTFIPPAFLFYLVLTFFVINDMTWQFWLVAGEVIIGAVGFLILRLFFRIKPDLTAKYGSKAYSLAFTRILLPALAIIFALIARIGFIPGPPIPRLWWYPILPALGWTLIVIGAVLWVRAALTFGVDNLTMLYVYFPRESQIGDHAIYAVIRHPIYGAAQRIGFGLALLNGNWFALTLSLLFALGLWVWVRLVEEKELIERFGESYSEYRKRTPAFWPCLRHIPAFFRFLLTGR